MRRFLIIALVLVDALSTMGQKHELERISAGTAPINIASEESRKSFIEPLELNLKSGTVLKSDFQVEFVDFPESAKSAFLYAISIYENLLASDVPIVVQAKWQKLGTNVLAHSSPTAFYKNFDGARVADVYYPVALVEKLSGKEINGSEPDIVCTFNSNMDWYLGTNGNGPDKQYDFVTVALHELVHGLGFSGFFDSENGVGNLKNDQHLPSIYDWYVYQNNLQVCDHDHFDMPSAALGNALQSGSLNLKSNDGSDIEKVYAPKSWNDGSSIYHYNESGFDKGDANALMSPYIFKGEAIHYPGEKTLKVLADLGWKSMTVDGLIIKDFEEAVATLPVSVEVSSELKVDSSSVKFTYSTNRFTTSESINLKYNKVTRKFEGEVPLSSAKGNIQYYYSASTSSHVQFTCPDNAPNKMYSFRIGADYYPPTLKHNPHKLLTTANPVLDMKAIATDNVGIESVSIIYRINGVDQDPVNLKLQGSDTYAGQLQLPDGLTESDVVEYRVLAKDDTQRGNKRYLPTSGYYTVDVFETAKPVRGYVNNFDEYTEDFEISDFEITRPLGFSSGNLHTMNPYPESSVDNEKYNLIAQLKYPVIIEENGEMSFDEVVLVEPGEAGTRYTEDLFWDFVIVEGSKDNGKSWLPVTEGYDSGADALWNSHFTNTLKSSVSEASGAESMFLRQSINLTADTPFEEGDTVLFRFRLASDQQVTGWGWAIDNLEIQKSIATDAEEILAENNVSVYPNPFQNSIYVDGIDADGSDLEVRVTDLYGKTVFRETRYASYEQRIKIDLPNVAPGIYLASISDNQSLIINQKIIKN
ncbi:T9SS type A sorting domain-containing protein [Maribellus sediminis]|uniref:T9SS type A sorting domain-containing protein n=1 Tax=Maribellus sediminis TaxID=2696285 RepID=UPI0014320B69|nr:T9SS type A sorting domain-containing protein [Maribellus sediminis]